MAQPRASQPGTETGLAVDPPQTGPNSGTRKVFVRGLRVDASIGVHAHEQGRRQPLVIDIEAWVDWSVPKRDRLAEVVDYQALARQAAEIAGHEHIQLVESLSDRIAAAMMADPRLIALTLRIAKPEALEEADAAGCESHYRRS